MQNPKKMSVSSGTASVEYTFYFYIVLFVLIVIFRLAYTTPIELDFDTLQRWYVANQIAVSHDPHWLTVDTHTMRWAVLIPQAIVTSLIPKAYYGYYAIPVVGYSLFSILLVFLLDKYGEVPRKLLILMVIGVSLDPMSQIMASQLKTNVVGLVFVSAGCIFTMSYIQKSNVSSLFLAVLCFFCSYGAHFSYVYFFIGLVFFLLGQGDRGRSAITAIIMFGALLLIETAIYTYLFQWEYVGRLGALADIEGGRRSIAATDSWKDYNILSLGLARFEGLPGYQKIVLSIYGICCLLSFTWKELGRRLCSVAWMTLSISLVFLLLCMFGMIGIDPLTPILTLRPRYLSPFFPFAICFVAIFLWRVFSKNILDRERPLLLTFTAGLLIIFVVSTKYETCAWESTEINWSGSPRVLFKKTYCGMFRYLNNQNIVPTSPTFFIFKADQFYREFGKDFRLGRVAVPGGGLAPLYEILMRHNMREIEMHKTRSDHYSIYGKTKEYCVDDLGRYKNSVADNYYECSSIGKRVDDTSYINFTRLGLRSGEN